MNNKYTFDHQSGKYFSLGDAKIYYEDIGDQGQSVLLFLHGGLGNIEEFNAVLPHIPQSYRIIGIDCRGHGKSTLGSKKLSYKSLQEDVEALLNYLKIDHLSIIGFSNGGTLAYRLACFSKLKINQLITLGSPWWSEQTRHLWDVYRKLTVDDWQKQCPDDFDAYKRLNPEQKLSLLFNECMSMALDQTTSGMPGESVENISCPVLALRGENDPVVSYSNLEELAKRLKQAKILNIPNAGHTVLVDQPLVCAQIIKSALGSSQSRESN